MRSTFIGHPISIINESNYNNKEKNLIAFLPGSRDNEINKLFPYLEYIYNYLITNNITDYKIFIPTLSHLVDKLTHLTKDWKIETIISVNIEKNEKLYNNVFISVTCSGTASLEISKRLIPQIVFYKLNFLTYFIFSFLVRVRFANILNILSKKMIIKEVVNKNLNKKNLLEAFDILFNDQNFRDKQILEIQKYLPEIQSKTNPYDVCEKRITEIISITI